MGLFIECIVQCGRQYHPNYCAETAEIQFAWSILTAAFDKSKRYNNELKFSEDNWVMVFDLIREKNFDFPKKWMGRRYLGTSPLSLPLRNCC